MRAYERLIKYAKIHTTSCEKIEDCPSTKRQFDLAKLLAEELKSIGVEDAYVDDKCYVYAHIEASKGYENCSKIGFIAHMDTAPDFSGENVNPLLFENYDGNDIFLGDSGRKLSCKDFKELKSYIGKTLITSDGKTLLGADDKAGIAEIMTAVEGLINENAPHGRISIAFTPDEEIGRGADNFNVEEFGADFAYTVDGGPVNEVEYENFNAAGAKVIITGLSVHPGYAKDKMINAALIAMEFNSLLPEKEVPSKTEDREGFFHLTSFSGSVEKAELEYIIRDHDKGLYTERKNTMHKVADILNKKYGSETVSLEITDQYENMIEKIKPHMHLVDNAFKAISAVGEEAKAVPIRGGTDGARLSFMGLPCPNLGTGAYDFHGPYEHICGEDMDKMVEIIRNIIFFYSK